MNGIPFFDGLDGFLGRRVIISFHGPVHVGQFHLAAEVHVDGRAPHRGVSEILHRISQLSKFESHVIWRPFQIEFNWIEFELIYPGIIDSGETGFGSIQDEESGQIGRVRSHDDHGESGPDHAQDAGRKAPGSSFADSGIEQNPPGEPNGRRQIQSVFLRVFRIGQPESACWSQPNKKI